MASSMSTIPSTLPTPAHSVNGSSIPADMSHDINMATDSPPHKRKRLEEDTGGREQKKAHIENRRHGIEDLHLDVGPKYLLCRTPHPPPRPRLTEDLFEKYGLTGIAADVARVLPNGEKNAIRKTYKGHIKRLGVQGRWDSVETDPMAPDGFLAMLNCPEQLFQDQFVRGHELANGLRPETRANLPKAMSMARGVVPKTLWDSSVLGDLGPAGAGKHRMTAPSTPNPVGTPAAIPVAQARGKLPTQQGAQAVARPQRNLKKRSYGDNSFEGYGEGFPDDDAGGDAYATGDGDPGAKRRKKNGTASPYVQPRQTGYGPSMVGA